MSRASIVLSLAAFLFGLFLTPGEARAQACRTGGDALARAHALSSPLAVALTGGIDDYVSANRSHFTASGDAVLCARALSQALATAAIGNFDPNYLREQQELNARLGAMGVSPGSPQASASSQLFSLARDLEWFAQVMPMAANGNWQPFLQTGTWERQQINQVTQMYISMLPLMPEMAPILQEVTSQMIELQRQQLVMFIRQLAASTPPVGAQPSPPGNR